MTTLDRVRIPADVARLGEVRTHVRSAAVTAGASGDCLDDLVQAVDEAVTNTIVHGYAGTAGWVDVTLETDGERLAVTIEDEAPTFDPTRPPDPDMTVPALRRGPGGMGIHLIRLGTDEQEYRPRPGGGNILRLTRALAARS